MVTHDTWMLVKFYLYIRPLGLLVAGEISLDTFVLLGIQAEAPETANRPSVETFALGFNKNRS